MSGYRNKWEAEAINRGTMKIVRVYEGSHLVWEKGSPISERFLLGVNIPQGSAFSITLATILKQNDQTTTAFPATIDWGDGTVETYSGELESFGSNYYRYRDVATHTYATGTPETHAVTITKHSTERLNVNPDSSSKPFVGSIDARGGTWGLPDLKLNPSSAANTTLKTLHVGNNKVGEVGYSRHTALSTLTFGSDGSTTGWGSFSGCTALGPNLELGGKSFYSSTFVDCSGIRKVWIRDTVETIGVYLFDSDSYVGNLPIETIYCEADSQPSGWASSWNYGVDGTPFPVVWGQKTNPF